MKGKQLIEFSNQFDSNFTWYRGKVAVEVLDSHVCMRHSNIPERLLNLKIRLSRELGYKVIEVIPLLLTYA